MSSSFYDRLREEALRQLEEAFRRGMHAGYTADKFFYDEAGTVPEREGPPNVGAVLRSLARAKGLLPLTARARRVRLFNGQQPRPRGGGTKDVPCTVVH